MLIRRIVVQSGFGRQSQMAMGQQFLARNLVSGQARSFHAVSAALVKQLRALTGSPLKDCMKALEENGGDVEASKDYLRKKGLAAAEKKMDRVAGDGLVGVLQDPKTQKITMI